jgi:N-acetylated-alpha-linked acidic dipeptidase
VTEVARDVVDPERNVSVLQRFRAHELLAATNAEERKTQRELELIRLDALGSGSDYTPFLQHLGVAGLDIGYSGESSGGSYHSVYDSFDHYTRFGDPDFRYGVTQAKTTGRLVLRIANSDVLPFEFSTFASTVSRYVNELTKLAETARAETEERNRQLADRTMELAADPTKPFVAPKAEEVPPFLNFAPLLNAVADLEKSAKAYDAVAANAITDSPSVGAKRQSLDQLLMHVEQLLTRREGLPRRPWFAHQIYAPGFYTGYGVKTVPGVREAIEQRDWDEASQQIAVVAGVIMRYALEIDRAAGMLSRSE